MTACIMQELGVEYLDRGAFGRGGLRGRRKGVQPKVLPQTGIHLAQVRLARSGRAEERLHLAVFLREESRLLRRVRRLGSLPVCLLLQRLCSRSLDLCFEGLHLAHPRRLTVSEVRLAFRQRPLQLLRLGLGLALMVEGLDGARCGGASSIGMGNTLPQPPQLLPNRFIPILTSRRTSCPRRNDCTHVPLLRHFLSVSICFYCQRLLHAAQHPFHLADELLRHAPVSISYRTNLILQRRQPRDVPRCLSMSFAVLRAHSRRLFGTGPHGISMHRIALTAHESHLDSA